MIQLNNPNRISGYVMPLSSLYVIEEGLNDVLSKIPEQDRAKAEKYLQSFVDSHRTLAERSERASFNEAILASLFKETASDEPGPDIKIGKDAVILLFKMAWIHQFREFAVEDTPDEQRCFIAFRAHLSDKWTEVRFEVKEEGISLWYVIRLLYDIGVKLGRAAGDGGQKKTERLLRETAFRMLPQLVPQQAPDFSWIEEGPTQEFMSRLNAFIVPGHVDIPQLPEQ